MSAQHSVVSVLVDIMSNHVALLKLQLPVGETNPSTLGSAWQILFLI